MLLLLRMKTSYLQKLPWLLAGLAHTSEDTARGIACKILEQWNEDPRPQAHHRVTADLLQPGLFLDSLRAFANGQEFCQMPRDFQLRVAMWRFVPVVETTIEEKHARVALSKKRHHLGPVRISLANRLPLLERWLQRGHVSAQELLSAFEKCRSLKKLPFLLGVEDHPLLVDNYGAQKPAQMRVALAKVIYHCDLQSMYEPHDAASRENFRLKRKAADAQARLVGRQAAGALQFEGVLRNAMVQHMLVKHDDAEGTCYYSAPRSCLTFRSVEALLQEPQTKRCRGDLDEDVAEANALMPELDVDVPPPSEVVTFQIVMKNPNDKKLLRPCVGAGGKLSKGAVVVCHLPMCAGNALTSEDVLISGTSSATQDVSGQFLLSNFHGSVEELQTSMRKWRKPELCWTLQEIDVLGMQHGELHDVLDGLVAAGAFQNNPLSLGFSALPGQVAPLQLMEQHGLTCRSGQQDIRWFLTCAGAEQLTSCTRLKNPAQLFQVRGHLKLEDRTTYELMMLLQEESWQWRRWVPVSKRTRRLSLAGHTFDEYRKGQPKLWYSTDLPSATYMRVLLKADELFEQGLPAIAHGRDEAFYKALLQGDFELAVGRLEDIPPELDALDDGQQPDVLAAIAVPEPFPLAGEHADAASEHDTDIAAEDDANEDNGAGVFGPDDDMQSESADSLLAELEAQVGTEEASPANNAAVPMNIVGNDDEGQPSAFADGPPPAAVAPAADVRAAAAPVAEGPQLENGFFGPFRITAKQPGTTGGGKFGGLQATCVFHKRSNVSGCKRYLAMESAEPEEFDRTMMRLMHWCTLAPNYDRQRDHLAVPLPPETCPPWAVLQAKKDLIVVPDPATVRSDVELDKAAAAAALPAPILEPKAKAKGKAKAVSAKSKSKAKAAPAAAKVKAKAKSKAKVKAKSGSRSSRAPAASAAPASDEAGSDSPAAPTDEAGSDSPDNAASSESSADSSTSSDSSSSS